MAFGQFTGYADGPIPGSLSFQTANGQNVLLGGAAAQNLKARLDASAGFAGQRVAGPGGGAPNDTVPPDSVMAGSGALNTPTPPAAGPAMSVAPPEPAAPAMSVAPPAAPPPGVGPTVENARAAEVAPAPAPMGPQPVAINGISTGYIRMPDGTLRKYVPGSAAITPAQLQAKAASGVATPHSASTTTQGGFTPDTDYLERRADLAVDKELLVDKAADAEASAAARDQALAAQQAHDAAVLQAQEQARANEIEARYKKDEATKDRLVSEYGNARVNPQRIFAGQTGTARAVLGILGAALGQAGSGMMAVAGKPGQPNLAFQAFNSMIDRDIAAQENEIKVKGQMADNALTQFQRTGMSLDSAKAALRAAQLQWGAAQLQQNAAINKGGMVDVNREMTLNSIRGALNDANEDYRQKALGNITQQVASQFVYPTKGSAGGYVNVTPGEAMGVIEKGAELGEKSAGTAKTMAETKKTLAQANAVGQPHESAEIHTATDALDNAAAAAGLTPTAEGGYSGEAHRHMVNDGWWASKEGANYTSKLRAAAPLILKANGERVTPAAIEDWMKRAQSMNPDQTKAYLESAKQSLLIRQANELKYPSKGAAPAAAAPAEDGESE